MTSVIDIPESLSEIIDTAMLTSSFGVAFWTFVAAFVTCPFEGLSNIVVRPVNTVAMLGDEVRLNCSVDTGARTWETLISLGSIVYDGCESSDSSLYATYSDSNGACDLVLLPKDGVIPGGTYVCNNYNGNVAVVVVYLLNNATGCTHDLNANKVICNGSFYSDNTDGRREPVTWFSCDGLGNGKPTNYMSLPSGINTYEIPTTEFDAPPIAGYECQVNFMIDKNFGDQETNDAYYRLQTKTIGVAAPTTTPTPAPSSATKCKRRRCGNRKRCKRHRKRA